MKTKNMTCKNCSTLKNCKKKESYPNLKSCDEFKVSFYYYIKIALISLLIALFTHFCLAFIVVQLMYIIDIIRAFPLFSIMVIALTSFFLLK